MGVVDRFVFNGSAGGGGRSQGAGFKAVKRRGAPVLNLVFGSLVNLLASPEFYV